MANDVTANVVIRINDREVNNSFKGIKSEVGKLERELQGMTRGTEEWTQKLAEVEEARRHLHAVQEEMRSVQNAAREMNAEISTVNGTFEDQKTKLKDYFVSVATGKISFKELGTGIKTFAVEAWTAISSIPLVGWLAAVATGIGLIVKEAFDFNKELIEANKLTAGITGLQNEALDKITMKARGMKDAFGFEESENLQSAKALVGAFGISYSEAMDAIQEGAIRGGKSNAEFLDSIKEYPVFFAKAGYSVSDFIGIVNAGYDVGIYSDKLPDAIKEFDLSMREQTKSTRDALVNAFGATFSDDILKRVSTGKTTVKDAMVEIGNESKKYNLTQKQQAQLTADIFRGAGEDAGGFLKIMQAVTAGVANNGKELTEEQKQLKKQAEAYQELELAMNEAFNSNGIRTMIKDFDLGWTYIKTGFYKIVALLRSDLQPIFETVGKYLGFLVEPFVKIYNAISQVSGGVNIFKVAWEAALIPLKAVFLITGTFLDVLGYLRDKVFGVVTSFGKWVASFIPVNNSLSSMGKYIKIAKDVLSGLFNYIVNFPQAYHAMEAATKAFFKSLANTFSISAGGLKDILSGIIHFDGTQISKGVDSLKNALKSAALDAGKTFSTNFKLNMQVKHDQEAAADKTPETPTGKTNNFDGSADKKKGEKKKKEKNPADEAKKLEAERQKQREALAASEKDLQDSENRKLELENKYNAEKLKLQEDSLEKEIAEANAARSEEFRKMSGDGDKMLLHITELENKKLKSKNPAEIANLDKAIKAERAAIYQNDLLIQQTEETHQLKLKIIREKWDAKRIEEEAKKAQQKIDRDRTEREKEINDISTMEDAKLALSKMQNLKLTDQELAGIKTLEDAKRALREDADRAALKQMEISVASQIEALKTALADPAISEEARKKLNADLDALAQKMEQIRGQKGANTASDEKKVIDESNEAKGKIDILGFSAKDWEDTFSNLDTTQEKIAAAKMAVQALGTAFQMFAQIQDRANQKEMSGFTKNQEKKKVDLKKQLDLGYITHETFNKEVQKLDAETARKKAELEYKQAKIQKTVAIASAIANTALGVVSALTMMPWTPANYALAAAVGIIGAVQIATIASQPLPEKPSFARGGFTGPGFGSPDETGYRPAGIVHQNEWVAPEWMTQSPRTAAVIDWLEAQRTGKTTGFADGGKVQETAQNSAQNPATIVSAVTSDPEIKQLLLKNLDFLDYLIQNGVYIENSAQNGKSAEEMIEKWRNLKNKNKH